MEKILYTNFSNIDDIIDNLAQKKELKKAITRHNLFKFWNKVAGEKFAKVSRPYSIKKGYIMVIACQTSAVAQELLLRKNKIMQKLTPYLESLNMKVNDLHFDTKKWVEEAE